jgi:hypothetical protein
MMEHLSGDRMQVVLVGDPDVITATGARPGLGGLQLLDPGGLDQQYDSSRCRREVNTRVDRHLVSRPRNGRTH